MPLVMFSHHNFVWQPIWYCYPQEIKIILCWLTIINFKREGNLHPWYVYIPGNLVQPPAARKRWPCFTQCGSVSCHMTAVICIIRCFNSAPHLPPGKITLFKWFNTPDIPRCIMWRHNLRISCLEKMWQDCLLRHLTPQTGRLPLYTNIG
jgi:hypothetical protein